MIQAKSYQVISAHTCPYVQRVTIALKEKNIDFKHHFIDLKNKPEWFVELSPFGKVPLLKISDNKVLFESQVINEYLDEVALPRLHPDDPFKKAQNRAWIELISSIIMAFGGYYYAMDLATMNDRIQTVQERIARLEEVVSDGPYFNGEEFSMVDAAAAPLFARIALLENYHEIKLLMPYQKVTNWSYALLERPSVQAIVTDDFQNRVLKSLKDRKVYIAQYLIDGDHSGSA